MEFEKLVKQVGPEWAALMKGFMVEGADGAESEYGKISTFLKTEKDNGRHFFPDGKLVFSAFRATPLPKVRVVILGQDPYPKQGFANGMAFATNNPNLPVSLKVMFDGIEEDVMNGLDLNKFSRQGDLMNWANQGVLLLNTALTVEADKAGSHSEIWQPFTEYLIRELAAVKRDLVWVALGAPAKKFTEKVNPFRSFIYLAEHPAFAAREKRKWKHNNVFTKTNLALTLNGLGEPIKW